MGNKQSACYAGFKLSASCELGRVETRTIEGTADQFSEPQTNMASKRIVGQSMSSMQSSLPLGLSAALREEKKTTRPTSVQQLNEISITLQGQQTVQEIVNKATQLFQCLQEASVVVDYKSKQEVRNNNKKVQETLNGLKELFARLRVFYDESNRRLEIPQGEDLEVGLALKFSLVSLRTVSVNCGRQALSN